MRLKLTMERDGDDDYNVENARVDIYANDLNASNLVVAGRIRDELRNSIRYINKRTHLFYAFFHK